MYLDGVDSLPVAQTAKKLKLSIVIPCYCSEQTIGRVVELVETTALSRYEKDEFEVILVNDCSKDGTERVIFDLCDEWDGIQAISFSKNFGQQAALLAGMRESSGEVVLCLDDDGETPPEAMFSLVDELGDDCDVVYASYDVVNTRAFRRFGTAANEFMLEHVLGKPHGIAITSYVAMKRFVVEQVIKYERPFPYITGVVLATTRRIKNVAVEKQGRLAGASGYTFSKLLALWMNGFTAYSVTPLRAAMWSGTALILCGLIGAIGFAIASLISAGATFGWQIAFCLMLCIDGWLLVVVGLVGEYVGRSYISIGNPPQYVIRRRKEKRCCNADR